MNKKVLKVITAHSFLIFVSVLSVFPFLWLISTAMKGTGENIFAYPPVLIPREPTFENFFGVWKQIPFMLYFWNSLVVAGVTVVLNIILSALCAYPLARMEFKGKKIIFFSILATIMVPFQAIMLPIYIITLKLHLTDTTSTTMGFLGLILPFAVSAFGIFLMRQAFLGIPKEM